MKNLTGRTECIFNDELIEQIWQTSTTYKVGLEQPKGTINQEENLESEQRRDEDFEKAQIELGLQISAFYTGYGEMFSKKQREALYLLGDEFDIGFKYIGTVDYNSEKLMDDNWGTSFENFFFEDPSNDTNPPTKPKKTTKPKSTKSQASKGKAKAGKQATKK